MPAHTCNNFVTTIESYDIEVYGSMAFSKIVCIFLLFDIKILLIELLEKLAMLILTTLDYKSVVFMAWS